MTKEKDIRIITLARVNNLKSNNNPRYRVITEKSDSNLLDYLISCNMFKQLKKGLYTYPNDSLAYSFYNGFEFFVLSWGYCDIIAKIKIV